MKQQISLHPYLPQKEKQNILLWLGAKSENWNFMSHHVLYTWTWCFGSKFMGLIVT